MKKTLIALAVLGTAAGVAHAQSNVTIYGVMDTGYAYQSGAGWRMSQNQDSKIGFRGVEDLGNGLKATFELERRFNLGDGMNGNNGVPNYRGRGKNQTKDWDGAANIGLAGNWGRVRFGRVNELSTETIRKFDPFYQYGVGAMLWSSQRSARIDNTARYDSPKWAGFSFGLSYSLGKNTKEGGEMYSPRGDFSAMTGLAKTFAKKDYDNDGYAVNLSYDNYGFSATGNWSRVADSDDSYVWNLGVGYKFGPAKVTLLYEKTDDKGFKEGNISNQYGMGVGSISNSVPGTSQVKSEQEVWLLGLEWDIGPGQFDASVQYGQLDDVKNFSGAKYYNHRSRTMSTSRFDSEGRKLQKVDDADILKYAIGYTYNLSKRTSAYAQVSYTDYDNEAAGIYYTGTNRDDNWGFQVGMTHKF